MERNSKQLSVIVPVYKAEKYLNRCVDSIIAQTWSNLEIILVDDGSPDNSGVICDEYATRDSRIRVIHKPNGGVSSARNAGIDAATGEYIAFVDSDDVMSQYMYEKLMLIAIHGYDIVISNFFLDYRDHEEIYHTFDVHPDHDDTYRDMMLKGFGCNIWNMVIRRMIIIDNNIYFPEDLKYSEDTLFALKLHLCSCNIAKVKEPYYHYNLANPKQATANLDDCFVQNKMRCIDEAIQFISRRGKSKAFEKELCWLILQLKTNWVFDSTMYHLYHTWHPEANNFVKKCPLLSAKMKLAMWCLNHRLYFPVRVMANAYKVKQRL